MYPNRKLGFFRILSEPFVLTHPVLQFRIRLGLLLGKLGLLSLLHLGPSCGHLLHVGLLLHCLSVLLFNHRRVLGCLLSLDDGSIQLFLCFNNLIRVARLIGLLVVLFRRSKLAVGAGMDLRKENLLASLKDAA